jgi:hypothetical protein
MLLFLGISVKYCPGDGLFRPKYVGNIVNTSYLLNIVQLLVLHHCSLIYKMHGETHIKITIKTTVHVP